MKRCLLLATLCAAMAGCAGDPPVPPAPPPPPPRPMAPAPPPMAEQQRPLPPAPSLQTPPLHGIPPARSGPGPALLLSLEERHRDEGIAVDALNKVVVPARGKPDRMRAVLGIPSHLETSAEQYVADDLVHALDDPAFVRQLATNMSDAELIRVQQHPSLAMEIAGDSIGHAMEYGFRSLEGPQQKMFLETLGAIFSNATPDECREISGKGGIKPQAGHPVTLYRVVSRLPAQTQQQFAAVLVLAMVQPHRPPPEPLTAEEQHLVQLNIMHYVNTLPDEQRDRLLAYQRQPTPADECWVIGQMIRALTSGDADLVDLGVRMFGSGFGRSGGDS